MWMAQPPAAHQGGLHEIMAEDVAAEGFAAAEMGQPGLGGEGGRADHGVVAPVIALRAVPPGDAVGDDRTVDPAGELLDAGEQGAAVDDGGQGLDQPDIRVLLHGGGEADDGVAGHDAVGVEDQELRVGGAPSG